MQRRLQLSAIARARLKSLRQWLWVQGGGRMPVFLLCWLFGIYLMPLKISQSLGCSNPFDHAKTFEALI
ncbi:MAG: hypothetical protein KDI41_13890 [Pseudomonadales bacterium]|uniref:hypothetical protein n=1 Tax=Pseudomonas TaxID=286 RepID=UPI000F9AE6CF|nr:MULTISPECIES: hypothetical protein [Pseudomonas]MCB1654950.1 hypothetical protein [Pseudomonadales bacterium]NBG91912.1 hypothetical protein [Pseudomonas sp. 9.1(2019)]NNG60021.1 hypothetical protein [Pseudomonas sp. GC01]RUT40082.1 hypothetical protein WG29040_07130 [Pseudomonas sp. PAMC 29040]